MAITVSRSRSAALSAPTTGPARRQIVDPLLVSPDGAAYHRSFQSTETQRAQGRGFTMDMDRDISRRHMLALSAAAGGLAFDGGISRAFAQAGAAHRAARARARQDHRDQRADQGTGHRFRRALGPAEGPLWWKEGGFLLFSDIHNNRRMKYMPGQGVDRGSQEPTQSRQRAHPRPAGPAALRASTTPGGSRGRSSTAASP